MNYTDLAATVTAQLVDAIEAGTGTWSAPWHRVPGLFDVRNATTGNPYRGSNTLTLALAALDADTPDGGHPTGWWATYRQWSETGAQVRRGEKATRIVKWVPARRNDPDTAQADEESGRRLVPKVYPVFNAAQVDGWTPPHHEQATAGERDARAEAWIAGTGATISYGHNHAAYLPRPDRIELPDRHQFIDTASFYSTTCHELVHWTAAPARLHRQLGERFGDDAYAAEELVAELGAAIACAHLDITPSARDDHAAYMSHWLRILDADPKALFTVAARAQAAVDHLDNLQPDHAHDQEGLEEVGV